MNDKIRDLLDQIGTLEEELRNAVQEHEGKLRYTISGRRIAFERSVREAHAKVMMNAFRWLMTVRPQNYLTAPIIYGMIVPLLFADLCVSLYQAVCFPVYRIAQVRRGDYIVYDYRHLDYLNFFEKFHCQFCAYANGLLAYAVEIVARTEQYFCPIKHARKILHPTARYRRFLEYGAAEDYHAKLEEFRAALAREQAGKQSK